MGISGEVITDWDGDLSALSGFDAVLVTPATRNLIASFIHGLMNGPLLMALSAARGRGCPIMMVPSMHNDLANDPVTEDLVLQCAKQGIKVLWGPEEEGKRKTPNHEEIVARLGNLVNSNGTSVVVTLGAARSAIDDVRYVQNTSSGKTGYLIADDLYRHGMDVTCVSGVTTASKPDWLPLDIKCPEPDQMLEELKALAKDRIDVWIHAAAVLDYIIPEPVEGKIASLQGDLNIQMKEGAKHISELKDLCEGYQNRFQIRKWNQAERPSSQSACPNPNCRNDCYNCQQNGRLRKRRNAKRLASGFAWCSFHSGKRV